RTYAGLPIPPPGTVSPVASGQEAARLHICPTRSRSAVRTVSHFLQLILTTPSPAAVAPASPSGSRVAPLTRRNVLVLVIRVRRPARVAERCGFVFGRKPEQRFEGTCVGIHTRVWVAQLGETLRNRQDGKIGRITLGNFVPAKRCGYARIRQRAHGIRRARRTVLRILVVVEKHAVPLLLPPLRSGQGRYAPLDGTRKRERGTPHFDE